MTNYNTQKKITLGYELDSWNDFSQKKQIDIDITSSANSHILICGMSGSGKSYFQTQIFARLIKAEKDGEFYFADYKLEDAFEQFRNTSRYFAFNDTLTALDTVYNRLNARLSNKDTTRNTVTLIWDEYIANILALISEDKKKAQVVMNKVSEILLMGRSKSIRLIISCQRADAIAFPVGSRLNYGVIVILGAFNRSVYEMLMTDYIDKIKSKEFGRGEGTILLQGSHLHFIKVPKIDNMNEIQEICRQALVE